jgi:hypothetical protein
VCCGLRSRPTWPAARWIGAPVWRGAEIDNLRLMVAGITTRERLEFWLDEAEACGIDPL